MKRKIPSVVLVLLSMILVPACWAGENLDRFNFSSGSPLEFLAFLKMNRTQKTYTIHEPILNWVKIEHISSLVTLLESEDECMAVALESSSRIRLGSTIGDEAAFLIAGFRAGKYPASLNSERLGEIKKDEILKWQADHFSIKHIQGTEM